MKSKILKQPQLAILKMSHRFFLSPNFPATIAMVQTFTKLRLYDAPYVFGMMAIRFVQFANMIFLSASEITRKMDSFDALIVTQ